MTRPLLLVPEKIREATLRWILWVVWGANAGVALVLYLALRG